MGKREEVIEKLTAMWDRQNVLVAIPVDEFFEGNGDEHSIAANLEDHPGLGTFRHVLTEIQRRPDVQNVFSEITDCPDPSEDLDSDEWPYCSVVFVVTTASLDDVKRWVASLRPDLVHEGWNVSDGIQVPLPPNQLMPNMHVFRVWWD